ncbi:MAG TPA: T9SS type A sorting domain-containing protein [Bacteroidia bacterium]|nr:T9SS type A sorting domain-containing protein [Bacteroidia bacterium]
MVSFDTWARSSWFNATFPFVQTPWSGYGKCGYTGPITGINDYGLNLGAPDLFMLQNYPNPFKEQTTIKYRVAEKSNIDISIFDLTGRKITTLVHQMSPDGTYSISWNAEGISNGTYIISLSSNGKIIQTMKALVSK